ncbi:MAG TPA: heme o synthase, partial [Alphaproteobacteria bacterium]
RPGIGLRRTVAAYIALTKPRIIELLLITTVPAMVLAAKGLPPIALVFWTLVGGSLAAGSANAINCYLDRDIDSLMARTRRRPLPAHEVEPERAVLFGLVLGVLSFVVLAFFVNLIAAFLAQLAIAFYVVVYTMLMKRSTPQNIVIGGAAGALPPVIGWAAVTGSVSLAPLLLFAIIFMWTPPHFWALALVRSDDYARAGVPMLPVVAGGDETRRQIMIYSIVLVPLAMLPAAIGVSGSVYALSAAALGIWFLHRARAVWRRRGDDDARRLFGASIAYLFLLFAALVVDHWAQAAVG